MYALCDVSSMYASCEKVFDPKIRKKPVIVLTNNDGCVCAVCPVAKKMGIVKMFAPYYQVKEQLAAIGAVIRSSNYELYADLSNKMMDVCATFAPDIHVYSIDECFLSYNKVDNYLPKEGWNEHALAIRKAVWRNVRLPIGVGIGKTPTLAKAANHAAKKLPGFAGVAVIDSDKMRYRVLSQMKVIDVWGVGRRTATKLNQHGVITAWQLANLNAAWVGKTFSVLLERTVDELNGTVRFSWDDIRPPKQEIYSTRSFGQRIDNKAELLQALAFHAQIAAKKLRKQHSLARYLSVFAASSAHDEHGYYRQSIQHAFTSATNDSGTIVAACTASAERIYRQGVRFYRCGVGLYDLIDQAHYQEDLFTPLDSRFELMQCIDNVNDKFGTDAVFIARRGNTTAFDMRRQFLSPQYTTRWRDLPRIKCC
ncbi:Y-family DNA polymerase [Gammaproteobacteria bacterium AS21]